MHALKLFPSPDRPADRLPPPGPTSSRSADHPIAISVVSRCFKAGIAPLPAGCGVAEATHQLVSRSGRPWPSLPLRALSADQYSERRSLYVYFYTYGRCVAEGTHQSVPPGPHAHRSRYAHRSAHPDAHPRPRCPVTMAAPKYHEPQVAQVPWHPGCRPYE